MFRLYKALPTLHGLVGSNLQTSTIRKFSCSATSWKKFSFSELDPDTQVVLVSPKDASETQMKYSEVLEKVGNRKLVRIQKTKTKNKMLTFQIMSEQDLEIATRKAKAVPGSYLGKIDGGRVKRKELELKSKISDHDFSFQTAKIIKMLLKENFVAVKIKLTRDGANEDAERLKSKILAEVENNQDILGEKVSRLSITIGR